MFCCCRCSLIHIWIAEWITIELMGLLDENVNCFFGLIFDYIYSLEKFFFLTSYYCLISSMCSWRNLPFLYHSQKNSSNQITLINLRYFCLELESDASLLQVNPITIAFSLTEFQQFGTEALRKVDLHTVSH